MINSTFVTWIKRPLSVVILLFLGDLITSYTLLAEWEFNQHSQKIILMVFEQQNLDPAALSDFEWEEFGRVIQNTIGTVLFLFLLFNALAYYFYHRQKNWAVKYVKSYCYAGAILSLMLIVQSQNLPGYLQFLNILGTLIYCVVAFIFYQSKRQGNLEQ